MIIILVGKMASGKTTVANILSEEYGLEPIITYTTREPRKDEIDDVDYHFISEDEFVKKAEEGFFMEHTKDQDGIFYGSAKSDYEMSDTDKVIVLDPSGADAIRQYEIHTQNFFTFIVYLDAPEEVLVTRALDRGDGASYISERIGSESLKMSEFVVRHIFNYKITTNDKTPKEIADKIAGEVKWLN